MGRPSIFAPKDGERSYRILALSKEGQRLFEQARARLKRLAKWPGSVSDADTVEAVLRGDAAVVAYLKKRESGK